VDLCVKGPKKCRLFVTKAKKQIYKKMPKLLGFQLEFGKY
jgi:hypothetical protein